MLPEKGDPSAVVCTVRRWCLDCAAGPEESSTSEVQRLHKFCRCNCWIRGGCGWCIMGLVIKAQNDWRNVGRSRPTQPSIPPVSVNEYQLRLRRQRQVWFISLADERGVCIKLWDPLRTRAIPERLRGVFTTRHYTNPRLPLPLHKLQCSAIETFLT